MKKLLLALLVASAFVTPAFAAHTVYLQEGGTIRAQSVWRTKGKVHVLVNRDTLTEFSPSEIDLKRTFPRKRRAIQKQSDTSKTQQTMSGAPVEPVTGQKKEAATSGLKLPVLPNLSDRNPESLIPSGKAGSIKGHKKEMADRLAD